MADTMLSDTIAMIAQFSDLTADQISKETELDELGIHSLELTEIIMEMEEKHDVHIDLNTVEAWDSLTTVGDLATRVGEMIAAENSKA